MARKQKGTFSSLARTPRSREFALFGQKFSLLSCNNRPVIAKKSPCYFHCRERPARRFLIRQPSPPSPASHSRKQNPQCFQSSQTFLFSRNQYRAIVFFCKHKPPGTSSRASFYFRNFAAFHIRWRSDMRQMAIPARRPAGRVRPRAASAAIGRRGPSGRDDRPAQCDGSGCSAPSPHRAAQS